ncbi:NUDIX domain-containing protein [Spongiibacter nanhainus]|uniref:ADP-ribose pyrophosphatase n=1 Tax=Spongiibacter nanhainus TaxID=2794344 RepID=A0A7T4QYA3_9GAMM|nr:NUDIX domain-containing protein [Spongiibacter nanhainus]QQD17034.1 NUDIX domain-containing protein [Spongiibacter nanhainus]
MGLFSRDDVEVDDDRTVWRGFFKLRALSLRHKLFAGGWGKQINRELFVRPPAVGVLPYDPGLDAVLLVEQFRIGALARTDGPWLTELVAGLIDKDESPESVARREALEEAGIHIGELENIAQYYSSPGASDEYFYLYLGHASLEGAGGLYGLPEEGEDIRARVFSFQQAESLLNEGHIDNAHTVIALQWLRSNRHRIRQQWSD